MTVVEAVTRDRYPTRIESSSAWIEPTDPALWPGVRKGPADPVDLATHNVKGFHAGKLPRPEEVHAYRQELSQLAADPRDP